MADRSQSLGPGRPRSPDAETTPIAAFSHLSLNTLSASTSSEAPTVLTPRSGQSSPATRITHNKQEANVQWLACRMMESHTVKDAFLFTSYTGHKKPLRKIDPEGVAYYVHGHGTVELQPLTQSGAVVEHVLQNVDYATSYKYNVLSTAQLTRDTGIESNCNDGDLSLVDRHDLSQGYGYARGKGDRELYYLMLAPQAPIVPAKDVQQIKQDLVRLREIMELEAEVSHQASQRKIRLIAEQETALASLGQSSQARIQPAASKVDIKIRVQDWIDRAWAGTIQGLPPSYPLEQMLLRCPKELRPEVAKVLAKVEKSLGADWTDAEKRG